MVTVVDSSGGNTSSATISVTRPGSANDTDRLRIGIAIRGSYTMTGVPSGFTLVDSIDAGAGGDPYLLVYESDNEIGSDAGPWDWTASSGVGGHAWACVAFEDGTSGEDASANTDTGTTTSHVATGVTVDGENDLLLAFYALNASSGTPTWSTAWGTELEDEVYPFGTVRLGISVHHETPGAGASGTRTGTSSASESGAAVVLSIPAGTTTARGAVLFGGYAGEGTITPARTARGAVLFPTRGVSGGAGDRWHSLKVEVAFTTDTSVEPGANDWTDITAYVRDPIDLVISRGRTGDLEEIAPGELTFTLKNDTSVGRRFDPASTFYGVNSIRPRRHIRVRADYRRRGGFEATTYELFRGVVRRWKPGYASKGKQQSVRVRAVDSQVRLVGLPLNADFVAAVEALTPFGYWKLIEESGTTAADDGSGANDGTYEASGVTLSDQGWDVIDPTREGVTFDGIAGGVDIGSDAAFAITGAMTFGCWLRVDGVGSDPDHYGHTVAEAADVATNFNIAWSCTVRPDGDLMWRHGAERYVMSDDAGGDPDFSTDTDFHFVVWTRGAGDELRCYIDGQLSAAGEQDGSTGTPASIGDDLKFGQPVHNGSSSLYLEGGMQDAFIVNDRALTAGEVQSLYEAQIHSRNAETADVRIAAVLDGVSWPAGLRDLETGIGTLQAATLAANSTAWQLIQQAARSELGVVFIDGSGAVRFHDRHYRSRREPVAIFGNAAGELPFHDVEYDFSDERIANVAKVTREGGGEQTATDETSRAEHGSIELPAVTGVDVADDTEASNMAYALAARRGSGDLVAQSMVVKPFDESDHEALWPVVLGLDIGDRLRLNWDPDGTGTIEQDSFVEKIEHRIGSRRWHTKLTITPADRQVFWRLGHSTLGETTRITWE